MSLSESFIVSIFSMALVFLVLAVLCAVVKILSVLSASGSAGNGRGALNAGQPAGQPAGHPEENGDRTREAIAAPASSGELKLLNVDEKTAAIIMAIVSDESGIPLSELRFKSIRAVD
jgi:Na+-transporting methylmalonyl-CoA/oxaloacetate decarboxylase gamma subunit